MENFVREEGGVTHDRDKGEDVVKGRLLLKHLVRLARLGREGDLRRLERLLIHHSVLFYRDLIEILSDVVIRGVQIRPRSDQWQISTPRPRPRGPTCSPSSSALPSRPEQPGVPAEAVATRP